MTAKQSLLKEIEQFLALSGMNESAFGHQTNNDGKLVKRLRDGGSVTLETADRIRKFIATKTLELEQRSRKRVA